MKLVDLGNKETWPIELLNFAEDSVFNWDSEDNCSAYQFDAQIQEILSSYVVTAFHVSRLLDFEILDIVKNGLRCLDDELIAKKINYLREKSHLNEDQLICIRQLESDSNFLIGRKNVTSFFLGYGSLLGDNGNTEKLQKYWGGDFLERGLSDREDLLNILYIGTPTLIKVEVDFSKLNSDYMSGFAHLVLCTYSNKLNEAVLELKENSLPSIRSTKVFLPTDRYYNSFKNLLSD